MDIPSVSSTVMDIYVQKVRSEGDMAEKIAKINLELKLKDDQMALAEEVLGKFYA